MERSREAVWLRDELILALDLYLRLGPDPPVEDRRRLSETLRRFPIEIGLAESKKFRSAGAVHRKLANFVRFDDSKPGTGLQAGGRRDELVWKEFAHDSDRLRAAVEAIHRNIEAHGVDDAALDAEWMDEAPEGRLLTRVHTVRERKPKLVARKKAQTLARTGALACEVCGFDFAEVYGQRGADFAECHHTVPVSQLTKGAHTKLDDLAIVCANCHRMIHRTAPWLTIDGLQQLIATRDRSGRAPSPA